MGMIGQLLTERYLILEELGTGGFSETYLARDKYLPHYPACVVKCLKPPLNEAISLETARWLFEMEARVLAQLGQHTQIPALFAYSHEHEPAYLVEEYIDGENLGIWLARDQQLTSEGARELLSEVLPILDYIHSQHVIHQDIKPSNLICRHRDGKVVLIDFGAARLLSDANSSTTDRDGASLAIGTPGYMPDEQHFDQAQFSSDLYALGMVVIHLLTGIHPRQFQPNPISGNLDWHVHLRERSLDRKLAAILDRMVQSRFNDRYQRATDVLTDLKCLSGRSRRQLPYQWQSVQRIVKPSLAVLLAGLVGGGFAHQFSEHTEALMTQLGQISNSSGIHLTLLKEQSVQFGIEQMLIAPNNRVLVTIGADCTIRLWSLPAARLLKSLSGHTNTVTTLAMSRDGKFLVSGAKDHTVRVWDAVSGQLLHTLYGHQEAIAAIAISPNTGTIASGSRDGVVLLWDLQTGSRMQTLFMPNTTAVTAVVFGAATDSFISASGDRQIQLWDLRSGKLRRTFAGHTGAILGLQVVGEQTLCSFGSDQVLVWNLKREELVQVLPESAKFVTASWSNRRLMTVHDDGSIQVWAWSAGRLVMKGAGEIEHSSNAVASLDHRYLVSWSPDRYLRVWQMNGASIH